MCPEVPPFSPRAAAAADRHGYWALRNYLTDYLAGEHYTPQAALWWAKWLWGSGHCRAWLEASQPVTGRQAARRLPVRCEVCRWEGNVVAEFLPGDPFHHDPPLDYVFGLPLRLATRTRHGWLWALNGDHLAELRAYVGAQERLRPSGHLQWASRLPAWLQAAKHRAEVLRALDKLVQQLQPE